MGVTRTTLPTCAPSASSPTCASRRAGERRLRTHDGEATVLQHLPARVVRGTDQFDGRDAGRCRREGRQGSRLSPRPRGAVDAAARRWNRGEPPAHAGRYRKAVAVHRRDCSRADEVEKTLAAQGIAVDPSLLQGRWERSINDALASATLTVPQTVWTSRGGRRGVHTECFGFLIAEMQYLHRAHPGGSW